MTEPVSRRPSITTAQNLGLTKRRRAWKWVRLSLLLVAIVGLGLGVTAWRAKAAESNKASYETALVSTGDLKVTVSTTGTIESVDSVEIGAEVSGKVDEVLVDFNDAVTKGQLLAKINTEQLDARVKEAQAQAAVAAASIVSAKATATESKANAQRMRSLADRGLISQKELESATATTARSEASVATALAQGAAASASLESAVSAREKAVIRSPIDGIVLSRSVEPGQTVAASLQAPVLFIVARDLTTMALKVDIDEADVGTVQPGQIATFTVDAHAGKTFDAKVKSLKNVPTDGQDVVTYEAELTVDNKDRLLRPGMTASATIVTSLRSGVLLVPNAALRFTPPEATESPTEKKSTSGLPGFGPPKPPTASSSPAPSMARGTGKVWVQENNALRSIPIQLGESDGTGTEVTGGALAEGTVVLVDVATVAK